MKTITLNGQQFPLRDDPPKMGRIMVLARAEKRGGQDAMVAYLDILEELLDPEHDVAEFEAALSQMEENEIQAALKEAAEKYEVDPSSARRETSSGSSDGSSNDTPTSRVVSLSRGVIEQPETAVSSTG